MLLFDFRNTYTLTAIALQVDFLSGRPVDENNQPEPQTTDGEPRPHTDPKANHDCVTNRSGHFCAHRPRRDFWLAVHCCTAAMDVLVKRAHSDVSTCAVSAVAQRGTGANRCLRDGSHGIFHVLAVWASGYHRANLTLQRAAVSFNILHCSLIPMPTKIHAPVGVCFSPRETPQTPRWVFCHGLPPPGVTEQQQENTVARCDSFQNVNRQSVRGGRVNSSKIE